ncbi:MAG TPA: NrtA/SsuA/CpmA family ABC transporter substrate-binding protein [Candidatus Binatia bacterium]|jgi:NitT/TauT family transport system substrate-binding protein|nr:NrtA/SsuA/CpmA family ABC transporter substrate-binding protein [Candidatus Binatia bacterium]
MKNPTALIVAGAAAILFIWAVTFAFVARDLHPKPAMTPVVIANVGEYSTLNLIAKEKGFFAKNGLDAKVDEYDSGKSSIGALLDGKADFAIAADFVGVTNIMAGADLRILAQVSGQFVFQVIALKDKGIAAPADLKGKTIGVTRKTAGELYLGKFLAANGLGYGDVTMVDLSPAEMADRISKGGIDAVVIFDPWAYRLQKNLADAAFVWPAQVDRKANGLAYTTKAFLADKPDAVERYLRSLIDAASYLRAHDAESRAILARAMKYDDEYVNYLWPKIGFFVELNDGLRLTLEEQARWLIANHLTERTEPPNFDEYIAAEPLRKAYPAGVLIR